MNPRALIIGCFHGLMVFGTVAVFAYGAFVSMGAPDWLSDSWLVRGLVYTAIYWVILLFAAPVFVGAARIGPPDAPWNSAPRLDTRRRIPVPEEIRWMVFQRDGYQCRHCGTTLRLTVDHIQPVSLGGTNDPSNLQTLCRSCNSVKSDSW